MSKIIITRGMVIKSLGDCLSINLKVMKTKQNDKMSM